MSLLHSGPPPDAVLQGFHPAVAAWFAETFPNGATPAQQLAWPAIHSGRHVLVSAPTGSGKTLTAFLAGIDQLVRQGLAGQLDDATHIVYVSPLKALSNDIHVNLEQPLAGIREQLARLGLPDVEIRTAVRTGDTPQAERAALRRRPPHILVTTPESLYVLLGSDSGRAMLGPATTVIVDEIHAVADDKRGSHLALSLERLEALCGRQLTRIGVSATQKPIDEVARFLVGAGNVDGEGIADCEVVELGYTKQRDLALELPPAPLSVVMSNDQWEQVYQRIAELANQHSTTLVFVNTRRMAERSARFLGELLGKEAVAAHHGSLSREIRLDAEQRLKAGQLKLLVATASLELGIDIGDVDLVCQLGSPRAIAAFLQRAGRSGHAVGGVPKARLFPASRDDLVECAALLDCVRRGELDALRVPRAPLDVLAQQIVAEASSREWKEDALYDCLRRAWPYHGLERTAFDAIVRMIAEGYASRRGHRSGLIHRDAVNRRLRGRKGGRLTAVTSGGSIADTADYAVIMEPDAIQVGSVHEDFAVESIGGDVFQLGNTSYRVLKVEPGRVRVEDAKGAPPSIPFWIGEAPGRTDELSFGVARLRDELVEREARGEGLQWLAAEVGIGDEPSRQLLDYVLAAKAALGALPGSRRIVLERFFDESGGTQLVIHSPFGSRINRAWGLALRKRFCRKFNFELQAAATEDAIVLSLSTSHSFPLIEVASYLHSASAQDILVQALLDAPLFGVRWRWNATTALALPRFQGGRKVAPQLQRMRSEDLLASVFPDQVACLENIVGERQVPDHPLVAQTLHDCLHEAMDADGWLEVLRGMESGGIEVLARDLPTPSPLAMEALNARPYAFLDDAPLEERRTQAVQSRRFTDPQQAGDLGRLDEAAIDSVREQAWPEPRNADEMHEALQSLAFVTRQEAAAQAGWERWLQQLARDHRATQFKLPPRSDFSRESAESSVGAVVAEAAPAEPAGLWVCAERLPQLRRLFPGATLSPPIEAPPECALPEEATSGSLLADVLRGRLGALGPVTVESLAADLSLPAETIGAALLQLEGEGVAMQGRFSPALMPDDAPVEWCERHLLARIHRYTLARLRREIEPVEPRDFMRFLCDWQRVTNATRASGPEALAAVLSQLEGFEAPASAWESELLPARIGDYSIAWLDDLCTAGRIAWSRLRAANADTAGKAPGSVRATPIVLLARREAGHWIRQAGEDDRGEVSSRAQRLLDLLSSQGASFFDDMVDASGLLRTEAEDALAELVARGHAHCDSFAGLRALMVPGSRRAAHHRGRRASLFGLQDAGRWTRVAMPGQDEDQRSASVEHVARTLLRRYGVLCWRLLEREPAWLPPWRELVRVLQRLEARGEIRGGRFVAGLSGEQFALPEAIALMRKVRKREHDGELVGISALDPLNLAGTVLPGEKVPRISGARLVLRDGVVVGTLVAGDARVMAEDVPPRVADAIRQRLHRLPGTSFASCAHGDADDREPEASAQGERA